MRLISKQVKEKGGEGKESSSSRNFLLVLFVLLHLHEINKGVKAANPSNMTLQMSGITCTQVKKSITLMSDVTRIKQAAKVLYSVIVSYRFKRGFLSLLDIIYIRGIKPLL